MKTITINVSEPVYHEFQSYAKKIDRTTSELIRDAMEEYRLKKINIDKKLEKIEPLSLGKVKKNLRLDNLMDEMLS